MVGGDRDMSHYYVTRNNTGEKCHPSVDKCRVEVIAILLKKMERADTEDKMLECADGIGAAVRLQIGDEVRVGGDTLYISQCQNYDCDDTADTEW